MLPKIFYLFVLIICVTFNVSADNEKALKYLKLCLKKSSSKYLFNHLYDSWNDDSSSLEQELKKNDSPSCQRLLVRLYEREGRDSEALNTCEKLLKDSPGESVLLLIKARLEFNAHNYEQCVKDLTLALNDKKLSSKQAVEIKKMLGSAYLRLDKEKQALAVWKKLYADKHELDFGEDVLQLMLSEGLYEEAKTFCEQLIKECKDKFRSLELSIKLAEIYRLKGSRKESLASYRKILAKTGTGSWLEKEIFSRIAQLYRAEDDNAGLLKFTADFLKEFKARSAIRLRYIDMLFVSGAEKQALEAYRELIKKAPLNKDYRVAYAKMLVKAKKYKLAVDIYAGLVKRFPRNSELFFSKALVEIKADMKQKALADIKSYIALNSSSEYAYIRAAKILESAKMNKEAGVFYKDFMKKFSDSVDALETYAVWLLRTGKTKEAVKLLTTAKDLPLPILLRRSKLLLNYKQSSEVYAFLQRFQKNYKNDFRFNEELFAACVAFKKQEDILKMIPVMLDTANSWDELTRAISSVCYVLKRNKMMVKYMETLEADKNLKSNNLCLLALMQSRLSGNDKALATLDAAINKTPGELMFYRQKSLILNSEGEYTKAADALKQLLKRDSKARAIIYRQLINLYKRADNKQEAIKWAAKLKGEFPDSVTSWMIFARLQEQNSKPEEAIKTLGRAMFRFPDNDELQRQLVSAYSSKGDMRGAINICWKILRQSNNLGGKLGMVTRIYRLSRTDDLKNSLTSRLKLQMKNNPKDIFPLLALAEVAKLSYNDNEYRDYVQKASQIGKKSIFLLNKLAEIDEEQGSYASAEGILKKIVEQDKTDKAKIKLANFYFRAGDDEKGMEIYHSYLSDKKDPKTLMSFAADMIAGKRPEEAVKILKNLAPSSDDCVLHYLLGSAYEDINNTELAVKEFMKAMKLSNTIKSKLKSTNSVLSSYTRFMASFPPAIQQLTAIQMLKYRIYQYKQQRYGSYNRYRASTSLMLPVTSNEAVIMTLCHFSKLHQKLTPEKQEELLKFIAACGVKYPDLALGAADNNYRNAVDVEKLLKKYSNDPDVQFYLCTSYNRQLMQQVGKKKLNEILLKLCQEKPEYVKNLFYIILQNTSKKNNKLLDLIFKQLFKDDNITPQQLSMLARVLINKQIKLEQKQKIKIKDLLLKAYKKLHKQKKISHAYMTYSVVNALLQNDFIADAGKLIKIELKSAGKNKSMTVSRFSFNPYYRPTQGLNFNKQSFPNGPLVKLPGIINLILTQRYGTNAKSRKNFFKACTGIEDVGVKLIAADGTGDKKTAAKIAEEINSDPKSSLSRLALTAAWFNKDGQAQKACEILLKARRLVKSKKDRKELNALLIAYALSIKDKAKIKKYVTEATKKLLRLNLSLTEKISLAKALRLAELNTKAAKLENALLKTSTSKKISSLQRHPNQSINIYQHVQQKFINNDTKTALNLAQREYRRIFRQIYGSFGGSQPGFYNIYKITRLCELIKRYKAQDLMLKKLLPPSSSSMPIKQCEYALACQNLGKEKIAEEVYKKILKKNPKNRFVAFQYVMLLIKGNYSTATPELKKIPLEDLILLSNNIYNFFKKVDPMLNFYDIIIKKMKETKNLNSAQLRSKTHYFYSLFSYLEGARHFDHGKIRFVDIFSSTSKPEKNKNATKEMLERRQKLYLEFCDQMMRIPSWAENAFCRKLLLFRLLKRDTSKFFDRGLKVMHLVNTASINSFGYGNPNHALPDFDSYMVTTALKNKRLPELLKVAKTCRDAESIVRRIKNLEKLVICPKEQFLKEAEKLSNAEDDDKQRREFQKLIIAIYQFRKLDYNLTPMILKEFKIYNENINIYSGQNQFGALRAWIAVVAKQKKKKILSAILKEIVDYYMKKYKKEFPTEMNVRSRFHQVFPWMMTSMLRRIIQGLIQQDDMSWYFTYKAFKPLCDIKMFSQQINFQHQLYQKVNSEPVEFLKQSPFLGSLKDIDFCPLKNYGGREGSLYNIAISRIRSSNKNKKKVIKYLGSFKKASVGVKIFEAILESSADKVFDILAQPQLKFELQAPEWQQEFCKQLKVAFNNKRISSKIKSTSKGWKIYKLYQKLNNGDTKDRITKFYKENINNDYWSYAQKAGKLVVDVAPDNPQKAVKIFEFAHNKLHLYVMQNPQYRNSHIQRQMLYALSNNSQNLIQCKVFYDCLQKVKKTPVNMLSQFYNRLFAALNKKYKKSGGNKKALTAGKAMLAEYENVFKNSKIIITYNSLSSLSSLSIKQLQELIKYQAALKTKSEIRTQINLLLQAQLENKQKHKIRPETMNKMWARTKKLPENWKMAVGLQMLNIPGCEKILEFLIEPALKMARRGNNQIRNYDIKAIVAKLALSKDAAFVKKYAPQLISYYALEMCNWKDREFKYNRTLISHILSLAYRMNNEKIVNKILKDFKMAKYPDVYIALANVDAEKIIKKLLDKNWRSFSVPTQGKLSAQGIACAKKICESIKDPEQKYIVTTMFAGTLVRMKDKKGRIQHNTYRTQDSILKKLAKEFKNIKFSDKKNKLFCLKVFFPKSHMIVILAEQSAPSILAYDINEILAMKDYNFSLQMGKFYFEAAKYGNYKVAIKKINELIKLQNSSDRNIRVQAERMLKGSMDYYNSGFKNVKIKQVKELFEFGRVLIRSRAQNWNKCLEPTAFLAYLAKKQKEFIADIKSDKDIAKKLAVGSWRSSLGKLKIFCKENKIDAKKEMSAFLDSAIMKEIYKKNPKKLKKIKEDMIKRFEKEAKQVKLSKKQGKKKNAANR